MELKLIKDLLSFVREILEIRKSNISIFLNFFGKVVTFFGIMGLYK